MKQIRRQTKYIKKRIFYEQKGKCNLCSELLVTPFFCLDHIMPLGLGGLDEEDNMQILCMSCHDEKTKNENYCK